MQKKLAEPSIVNDLYDRFCDKVPDAGSKKNGRLGRPFAEMVLYIKYLLTWMARSLYFFQDPT
jgi:hypothetical protein